jgi:hypothetical protein
MKNHFGLLVIVSVLLLCTPCGQADLLDILGLRKSATNAANTNSLAVGSLSQDQIAGALKEALGKGLQHAISQLGHEGGFLTNLNVRIPMPEKLHSVEKTLRALKQEKLADEFVATMNRAAEQAVPEAAVVFTEALKQMTIADARAILTGTNNAATVYFRQATQTNLFARFHPIVQKATSKTGVTASYKNMMSKITSSSALGGALGGLLGAETTDIDTYVTNKALDGLFKVIADEEKRIRQNPAARTSELLQKVFGSISR